MSGIMDVELTSPEFVEVPMSSSLEGQYPDPDSSPLLHTFFPQQQELAERANSFSMFAEEPSPCMAMNPAAGDAMDTNTDPFYTQACILQMCLQDEGATAGNLVYDDSYYPHAYAYPEQGWLVDAAERTPSPLNLVTSTSATPPLAEVVAVDGKLQCSACGRSYVRRTALVRHIRLKHGPRLWHVCHVCGKGLANPRSLRYHMCLHTGERLFPCPEPGCGAGFMRRPQLLEHRAVKHTVGLHAASLQVVHRHVGADTGGVVFVHPHGEPNTALDTTLGSPDVAGVTDLRNSISATGTNSSPGDGGSHLVVDSVQDGSRQEQQQHREQGLVLRLLRKEPGCWEVA